MSNIRLLYIDLFCGAGGTSTGVSYARVNGERCAKVIACVNHDKNAILSHQANHPDTLHFTEDIRTLDLTPLVAHLEKMKEKYPSAHVVLWASLECTNFSKAKGGQPRDADSRTLAEHLFRYVEAINPDYIQIENVEEFMCWGDLDDNGKPISKDKGRSYLRWISNVRDYGYNYDYRILNAADYGAYTSRKRFFGQFARIGLPIVFPMVTHQRKVEQMNMFHDYKLWKPVKDVLNLDDEGTSIFTKKKPLCERTLERILAGLIKFVAGGKRNYESMREHRSCSPMNDGFLTLFYGGKDHNQSLEEPSGTVTTIDHHAFVSVSYGNGKPINTRFLVNPQYKSPGGDINDPCFTLIAKMDKLPPSLITTEAGTGICISEDDSPMTRKIKEFMALYGIYDIKMRMLRIVELKRIMGFPDDYTLIGTQAEQKKFIGNAVEVNMSRVLCEALCQSVIKFSKIAV